MVAVKEVIKGVKGNEAIIVTNSGEVFWVRVIGLETIAKLSSVVWFSFKEIRGKCQQT